MSWITAIWAMLTGACIAMALPHLLIWIWQRRIVHLLFVVLSAAVVTLLLSELALMHSSSVEQFARILRWRQFPVFVLFVAIVVLVRLYFGTGRWWLGIGACGVRLACLIANFASLGNIYYRKITTVRPVQLLGDTVLRPVGVANPWSHLTELSSLLMLAFVADASISLWRQGTSQARRKALIVGGSLVCFNVLALILGILGMTIFTNVAFVVVLVAMASEFGLDLIRAGQVAQKLQASESSLLESETRFGRVADAAPVMIWMAGPDKLCTFFNKAWLTFTGRTMDQELGNGWSEGVHPDDLEGCVKTYVEHFDALKPFFMKYRLRRHDGEYRYVTDSGVPRWGARGKFRGYIGACADITDLLQQQKALHEIEERVTLAADAAHLGVWELDANTKELWISDKARELFQFPPEDPVTYDDFRDRTHPEDRSMRDAALKQALETRGSYEIEYRALLPDGTVRWISGRGRCVDDDRGERTRMVGVSMDITERKQAQELFRLATEASLSGIILVDNTGQIILVNAQIEKQFSYWRDELIGKPVEILVPDRFVAGHPKLRAGFFASPEPRSLGAGRELFARRKDGSEFPVEIAVNPIRTPEGVLVLATVIDITQRKLADEQARKSREEIDRLSRISLLGEMTASIAHELGQPLSGISSNASAGRRFIDRGNIDMAGLREILVDIDAQAHRANDVMRNIRNTVKKGAALRERINLTDLITRVGHMLQPDARAHSCELKISLPGNLPSIEGDPIQIQQVLVNLVGNAFEAMRDMPRRRRKVEIAAEQSGNGMVCVSVRDQGVGISVEARGRIFDQFFTTKEEGLGMGLAIVRSVIEAHGGKIEVEDLDGAGARFFFTLPVSPSS